MKRLADICDIQYGYAFDSKCFTEDSSYPQLVRIRDVKRGYSETYYSGNYPEEYILSEGDLLIGMDGEFNIARWKCSGALLNQRVCKLTTKVGTNEEYLRFAMLKSLKEIEQRTAFVTVKHLSAKELNKLELDVPELTKQDKIADTLSRLERVIEARKEELEKLDELIKARFVELFGDPDNNEKSWDIDKMEHLCEVGSSKRIYQNEQSMEGAPFLRISDLVNRIDTGSKKCDSYIPIEKFAELKEQGLVPRPGDILLTARGTLGRCYIVQSDDEFYFQDGMITWLSNYDRRITALYISYLFEMSEEWLDFIIACRSGKSHTYDIVIGAMADDQIYNYVSDYMDGVITREQFWVLAKFRYPTHQIAFCTDIALQCLEYRNCEVF